MRLTPKTDTEQPDPWPVRLVAFLTAALTLITPVAGAFAAATGGLTRVLRNEPAWSMGIFLALVAGFLAMVLGFAVLTATGAKSLANATRIFAVASLFISIALIGGAWLAATTAQLQEEPSITVSLTSAPELKFDVIYRASGLQAAERMNLEADGYTADGTVDPLFRSVGGPTPAGDIDVPVSLSLSVGRYQFIVFRAYPVGVARPDCNAAEENRAHNVACAFVVVPQQASPSPGQGVARPSTVPPDASSVPAPAPGAPTPSN